MAIQQKQKQDATKRPSGAAATRPWRELVQRITPENQHGKIDWGKPVGNE